MFADLDREREILTPLGVELAIARDQSQETLVAESANAVGMLVCFAPVTRAVIEAAAAAAEAGIQVTNVPDYCLDEVARPHHGPASGARTRGGRGGEDPRGTAFHSVEATEELRRRAAEEVARALRGEAPECRVNSIPPTVS